jgi:hypothetical protein
VILCFNGETIKVPLSEKKDYTSQGATVGKCKKAPPGDDDDDDSDCDPTVEVCSQGDDDDDDDSDKVCICHIPPGNPDNAHTICIGEPAVAAHIRNHGDYLGECQ